MNWYYKFLVRRPYLVILGIVIFSSACIIVALTTKEFPDFSDPTLGFEARGTEIGKRLTAWRNLLQETEPSGKLVADPNDLMPNDEFLNINNHKNRKLTKNKKDEKLKKDFKKKFKLLKKFTSNKTISINSETSINKKIKMGNQFVGIAPSQIYPVLWVGFTIGIRKSCRILLDFNYYQ